MLSFNYTSTAISLLNCSSFILVLFSFYNYSHLEVLYFQNMVCWAFHRAWHMVNFYSWVILEIFLFLFGDLQFFHGVLMRGFIFPEPAFYTVETLQVQNSWSSPLQIFIPCHSLHSLFLEILTQKYWFLFLCVLGSWFLAHGWHVLCFYFSAKAS